MSNFVSSLVADLKAFHRDENGLTTVESLLLLGGGLLVMLGIYTFTKDTISVKVDKVVADLFNLKIF